MDGFANLIEFSIALAGFTSIVVVFVHKEEKWNAFDKFRINNALIGSLGASFLAAVPSGLEYFSLSNQAIWQIEALLVGLYIVYMIISVMVRKRIRLSKEVQQQLPRKIVGVIIIIGILYAALIFSTLVGLIQLELQAISYFGIIYLLLVSVFAFLRIIFYRPIDSK